MERKLRIKLISPTANKLMFVKLIKECSGLGLREAKDLCDNLHTNPGIVRDMPIRDWETMDWNTGAKTPTSTNYYKKFIDEIKNVGGQFSINGGVQWERNVKILKLGLADKSDFSDFIKNYIVDNFEDSENILNLALSKLSKEQLEEVFNQINTEQ